MQKYLVFIALLVAFGVAAQDAVSNRVQFLFVGDVMQHGGQIQGAYNAKKDTYDYRDCFQFVKPVISAADIAVANLEVTHAGKPYKGYPQFSAPPELSEALVDAGFDIIVTANNHACDGGGKGVTKTLDELDKLGVKHTGTFRSKAERDKNYPLMVEKNGLKIAVLNYTYGTNGLSVAAPLIINYIDSTVMKADFKKAKALGADLIVCTMHWGTEYQSLPNDYQQRWEAFCYRQGADMVIGGHPHVLQPVALKKVAGKERLTAWSLGNFVSNQRDRYKDGGMMLTATVSKSSEGIRFEEVNHYFTWVYPRQEAVVKPFYILPEFNYNAHRGDFLDSASLKQMNLFFSDSRALYEKHAKGTTEKTVAAHSKEGQQFRLLLEGYYALELDPALGTDWKKLDAKTRETTTKVLDCNGDYHLIYGIRPHETVGISAILQAEFRGTNDRVVFIAPKEFKIISE
jgi:poly-gamma-glutamate capsule biosynthesis protein CapA/YwtB (metallophosphatase superfamily)